MRESRRPRRPIVMLVPGIQQSDRRPRIQDDLPYHFP